MSSPSPDTEPARRLRSALEPIATLSFHGEPASDAFAAAGLDEFGPWYTWSRSSVLGPDVDPAVVVAAFGVWNPEWVTDNLRAGRAMCSHEQIRRAADEGAGAAVRDVLADVDTGEIDEVTAALRDGIAAGDTTARALFAGHRALAPAADRHTDLWRAATAWRELRGDANLAAWVSHGISGLEANILNELVSGYTLFEYTATRNWPDEQMSDAADALRRRALLFGEELSPEGQALRDRVEAQTDGGGDRLERVVDRSNAWSQLIIDRGWFPDDEQKRAAG